MIFPCILLDINHTCKAFQTKLTDLNVINYSSVWASYKVGIITDLCAQKLNLPDNF